MLSNFAKKLKVIPSYFYRNYAAPRIYSIRDRKILSKNLELKNIHAEKRCFIVGAGPSIATTDLSKLNKEFTFVMNEFEKNPQYKNLMPSFHTITETDYFDENGPEYWRNSFKEKSKIISPKTTMIVSVKAKPFIEKYNLFQQHKTYYVGTQGIFTNNFPFSIELDRYLPNPKNSILMCIASAVWMDFKEIYLLGCEHSFLAKPLGPSKSLGYDHFYEDESSELKTINKETLKQFLSPKLLNSNYEQVMENTLQLFHNYRLFYAKALKYHPGLKIFNATPNSFLDVFPMVNFNDIKEL